MTDFASFSIKYDARADVLYLNVSKESAIKGIEDVNGIVWRYGRDGKVIGATIMDFYEIWVDRQAALADEISHRFHVPAHLAASVIGKGFAGRDEPLC